MKGQIKKVLTILFAVLFVTTLTASAVSADDRVALKPLEISTDEIATLTPSTVSVGDNMWCGTPWWPWWPPYPWPPRPDPWPPGPDPWFNDRINEQRVNSIGYEMQIENVQALTSM
jgi:hypothetical protein